MQQHQTLSRRESLLSYFAAFGFILAMVGVAEFQGDREIVLPEIAAMAVALWAFREQSWMRQPEKIFLWPSVTALAGFGINLLALPYMAKIGLVLIAMLGLFALFRYSLAPALATGFLPIVTNATDLSFLVSIAVTTLVLMLGVMMFRLRSEAPRIAPVSHRAMLAYLAIIAAGMTGASAVGYGHLAVLPPVAVVIYESLHMKMYSSKMVMKQTVALTLSAAIGVAVFSTFSSWILVAAVDLLLMAVLLKVFGMRMPAVYAFPFLAFVFPPAALPALPVATALLSAFSLLLVLGYRLWFAEPRPAVAVPASREA